MVLVPESSPRKARGTLNKDLNVFIFLIVSPFSFLKLQSGSWKKHGRNVQVLNTHTVHTAERALQV